MNLPDVSAFPIEKELDNCQNRFYGSNNFLDNKPVNVNNKIKEIFNSNNHVYKSKVIIKTNNDILEKVIVGRTPSELLTLSGEKIKIVDILDIEKL